MSSNYTPLNYTNLEEESTFCRPTQMLPERVTAANPALDVMTDFRQVAAVYMGPCANLDAAEKRMIASGVRLLLVVNQSNHILGVITLTDLQGERPMRYLQEIGGGKREEVFLQDIMTTQSSLDVLQMDNVKTAQVGDIIETMKLSNRQHALVMESDSNGEQRLRGLFSTKQISIQLGLGYTTKDTASILAELELFLK